MRILAISAHPDDETLGCGGTLLKHQAAGDDIHWLIATVTYEPNWSQKIIALKAEEVETVARAYGARAYNLSLPTACLDTTPQSDLIAKVGGVIKEIGPEVVYLIHGGDVHTDHGALFTATMSVLKAFHMRTLGVRRVLAYETLSSTEAASPNPGRSFVPNVYSDITAYLERKLVIMSLYGTEIQSGHKPRSLSSIRAQARYRGAAVDVEYAEAFSLVREVQ